ncbi:MAG: hypothetical protein ACFFDP_12545 [Promethearchaeota archaeon]
METRWSDAGYIGSIFLAFYGFLYFIIYHLPISLVGAIGASILFIILGVIAWIGGVFLSFGFIDFYIEFKQSGGLLSFLFGLFAWNLQALAHIFLAIGHPLGATLYGSAIFVLMLTFLIWGITMLVTREKLEPKNRYALYTGILFLINGIGWMSYFGIGILILACILSVNIFAPSFSVFIFPAPAKFFNRRRQFSLGQFGMLFLVIYSVLTIRWLVNLFFPFPVIVAAVLNLVGIFSSWLMVIGLAIVLNLFKEKYSNRNLGFGLVIGIPSLLLLGLADFTWFMSNINYPFDVARSLELYFAAPIFLGWATLPLFLSSLLVGFAFIQIWLKTSKKKDTRYDIIGIIFLISSGLWIIGLGYFALIIAGPLLYFDFKKQYVVS